MEKCLKPFAANTHLFHANFIHFSDVLSQLNIPAVDGILLDLGISLHQLELSGRGFSFKRDEPLDMRMDKDSNPPAEEIINRLEEGALEKNFYMNMGKNAGRVELRNRLLRQGNRKEFDRADNWPGSWSMPFRADRLPNGFTLPLECSWRSELR